MTPAVILLMGVSGSGKSVVGAALAGRLGGRFFDADGFHPAENVAKMSAGTPLTDDDRWPWLERLRREVIEPAAARSDGATDVLACSALKKVYRDRLMHGIAPGKARLVFLNGDFELIRARMLARKGHFMPESLLRSQYATLEAPGDAEAMVVPIDRPPEEIVQDILFRLTCENRSS